ncbi:hypothetical protein [Nocardia sp. CY41]|uniref:hypothetical protein n=1 Tax=Nocardia sp. CY41 TaxID=2608686 RepID=UPI001F34D6DB|nr:hypothetical protein [Nocardia sp. CY41]
MLEEGHLKVEPGSESEPRGMLLLSRADLADRLGADPDDAALARAAAELDAEVRLRGA